MYGFFADCVVFVHVCYVAFVVLGQLFIMIGWLRGWQVARNFWFRITHLILIGVVVFEEIIDVRCPLSIWEQRLRELAGQPTNSDTFLGRMMHALIFHDWPPYVFTILNVTMGTIILITLIFFRPRWPAFVRRRLTRKPGAYEVV